ncbi:ABC transporter substrate-binding protein [Saccharopolyspora halophila]
MISSLLVATACSSGSQSSETSGKLEGRGPITFATGKDDGSGLNQKIVDKWNKAHPQEPVRLIELPASGDEQRQQMIQNAQTKSDAFTVLDLDHVWLPEFAANRWISRLPEEQLDSSRFLQPNLESAKYRGRLFAVPHSSDGAMLYYRKDLLAKAGATPPKTWEGMQKVCEKVLSLPEAAGMSCYTGQFEKYEGLVANFAEAVHSAGGEIVGKDGKARVNTPQAERGLEFLVDGFRSGMIARESIAFKEAESRKAFQDGKVVFSRWWPAQWSSLSKTDGSSSVAGKFDVTRLPGLTGPGVSALGGHNLAISAYGENKATAMDFIKFRTSEQQQKFALDVAALAPSLNSVYDDPALQAKYPYLPVLRNSIASAQPRPRVINYGEVTQAIQDEVYGALSGDKSSHEALADLQQRLERLIKA